MRTLRMDPFVFQPFAIFVGIRYAKHAGIGYLGHHNLIYHVYFVLDNFKLPDAVESSYSASFSIQNWLRINNKFIASLFPQNR